jgi:hypothetical protein
MPVTTIDNSALPTESLNCVQEAAEHDSWFREQVEHAFNQADKADAVLIPHEVVMSNLKARLDKIAKQLSRKG